MPGILNEQVQGGGPAPAAAAQPAPVQGAEQPAAAGGEEQATPEEQKAFESIEVAAMSMLYDEKAHPQFIKMLKEGEAQPAQTMAQAAMTIFGQIDDQSNGTVPEAVIIQGAVQVLEVVFELVEKAQIYQLDENMIGQAVQHLLMLVGSAYDIDPEEMQQLMAGMDQATMEQSVAQQQQISAGENQQPVAAPQQEVPV